MVDSSHCARPGPEESGVRAGLSRSRGTRRKVPAHDEEPRAAPEDERAEGKGEGDEAGRAVEEEAESLCADVSERDEGVPDKVAEGDGAEPLFGDGLAVERVDCELRRGVAEEVDGDGRRDKGIDPADLRECARLQRSPGVEVGRERERAVAHHVQVPVVALPAFLGVVPSEHARAEYGARPLECKAGEACGDGEVGDGRERGESEGVCDGLGEVDPRRAGLERGRRDPRHGPTAVEAGEGPSDEGDEEEDCLSLASWVGASESAVAVMHSYELSTPQRVTLDWCRPRFSPPSSSSSSLSSLLHSLAWLG